MAPQKTKRERLSRYLAETRPQRIGETEWAELAKRLAPISESYLRDLLRASGIPLDPFVEGVRQDSFEEFERTLIALGREYARAVQAGSRRRAELCRRIVITSKDHARLALRNPKTSPETKARKEEMISWMLVWLENPSIFPDWVRLLTRSPRKRP